MSYLPPVGWADVATKQDLTLLETKLSSRIDVLRSSMESQFAGIRAEMERGFARQTRWTVSAMLGLTAIFTFVVGLFTFLT
jgi:hypothetical protein